MGIVKRACLALRMARSASAKRRRRASLLRRIAPASLSAFSTMAVAMAMMCGFSCPSAASAQGYAVGQRVECDPTALRKYYLPGVVIAPHPGETYNGNVAGTGYFYRVRLDGRDPDGTLCLADQMRRPQATAPAAAAPAAMVPVARRGAVPPAGGQPGRFGTREPRTCAPVKTRPTLVQIKALVQCEHESKSRDLIYLDENLSVEAGGTRPYSQFNDGYSTGIDTTAPVIPIRGNVDAYQCAALSKFTNKGTTYDTDNTGRNCVISPVRRASGTCYRTTFGDWQCHLTQVTSSSEDRLNQPPPR